MSLNAFKCLVTLQWLTGEDGRVSFSKLVSTTLVVMLGLLPWHVVDSADFVDSLWPLVWLYALTYAGSHGIKGLQLWFGAARVNLDAKTALQRSVLERRDPVEGI